MNNYLSNFVDWFNRDGMWYGPRFKLILVHLIVRFKENYILKLFSTFTNLSLSLYVSQVVKLNYTY